MQYGSRVCVFFSLLVYIVFRFAWQSRVLNNKETTHALQTERFTRCTMRMDEDVPLTCLAVTIVEVI